MLTSISLVRDAEMICDGGSLAASFIGANGSKYCLWFTFIKGNRALGQPYLAGYSKPLVFEQHEFRSENRFEWRSVNEVEVS